MPHFSTKISESLAGMSYVTSCIGLRNLSVKHSMMPAQAHPALTGQKQSLLPGQLTQSPCWTQRRGVCGFEWLGVAIFQKAGLCAAVHGGNAAACAAKVATSCAVHGTKAAACKAAACTAASKASAGAAFFCGSCAVVFVTAVVCVGLLSYVALK